MLLIFGKKKKVLSKLIWLLYVPSHIILLLISTMVNETVS